MEEKNPKTLRFGKGMGIRKEETSEMLIEGYPIVFEEETEIWDERLQEYYLESIARTAFDKCDMSDVCGKYNHNDNVLILVRTRNKSLELSIDDHGVFTRWHLCDTTTNRDIYEMVRTELLTEGSFAFYIDNYEEWRDSNGMLHRRITEIGKLTDVALCPNGAYGDKTHLFARSYEWLENRRVGKVETLKRCELLRLRNRNKIKLIKE